MTQQAWEQKEVVQYIRHELLSWYRENKRDLPWRRTSDPYRIWVSEVMLQQTRVDTVIPYYERFISLFPTVEALANASIDQVIKAWEGLGYYSRARNLHQAAKVVKEKYHGKIPNELHEISKLKGIGSYTAGAILSIAFNKKVPAVDGNVLRVFSRLFALEDDISLSKTKKKMECIADLIIPEEAPGDFNQALMELGALICTPSSPQCLFCPVRPVCRAYLHGMEEELPVKKKQKSPKLLDVVMLILQWENSWVVEKRTDKGLLAGLWGLPTVERQESESPIEVAKRYCDTNQLPASNYVVMGTFSHIFSHRHWRVVVVKVPLCGNISLPATWEWVNADTMEEKAFANVYRKALPWCIEKNNSY